TDAFGSYSFGNLPAGTYRVRADVPTGWVRTTPNPVDFVVGTGTTVPGIDFGIFRQILLNGQVFTDGNGNGLRDLGEGGRPGVAAFLDPNSNGLFDSGERLALTDVAGSFSFSSLGPGTYRVRAIVPAGMLQTTAQPPDVVARSGSTVTTASVGLTLAN